MKEIDALLQAGFNFAVQTDEAGGKTITAIAPAKAYDSRVCRAWLDVIANRQQQAVDYFEYLCKYPLTVAETQRAFAAAVLGNNTWVEDATFTHRYTGEVVSVPTPQAMADYTYGDPGPVPVCRISTSAGYIEPVTDEPE